MDVDKAAFIQDIIGYASKLPKENWLELPHERLVEKNNPSGRICNRNSVETTTPKGLSIRLSHTDQDYVHDSEYYRIIVDNQEVATYKIADHGYNDENHWFSEYAYIGPPEIKQLYNSIRSYMRSVRETERNREKKEKEERERPEREAQQAELREQARRKEEQERQRRENIRQRF